MPAWSTEIGREFVKLADAGRVRLDQLQVQKLVYIAHGWCLAGTGEPLTGDRPEAWKIGPIYRRLACALGSLGADRVTVDCFADVPDSGLSGFEMDQIAMTLRDFGRLSSPKLFPLTQGAGTPWLKIYADGSGERRDIPHRLIRDQFCEITEGQELAGQQR